MREIAFDETIIAISTQWYLLWTQIIWDVTEDTLQYIHELMPQTIMSVFPAGPQGYTVGSVPTQNMDDIVNSCEQGCGYGLKKYLREIQVSSQQQFGPTGVWILSFSYQKRAMQSKTITKVVVFRGSSGFLVGVNDSIRFS